MRGSSGGGGSSCFFFVNLSYKLLMRKRIATSPSVPAIVIPIVRSFPSEPCMVISLVGFSSIGSLFWLLSMASFFSFLLRRAASPSLLSFSSCFGVLGLVMLSNFFPFFFLWVFPFFPAQD